MVGLITFATINFVHYEKTKSQTQRINDNQVRSALVMGLFYGGIMVIYFGGIALAILAVVVGGGYLLKYVFFT